MTTLLTLTQSEQKVLTKAIANQKPIEVLPSTKYYLEICKN